MRQGLEVVFGSSIMSIDYTSREEAQSWMQDMGTSASEYLEEYGAVLQPVSKLRGGDVVVRPGIVNGLPRLAFALDDEVLITSDPMQGPHWRVFTRLAQSGRLPLSRRTLSNLLLLRGA